MKRPHLQSCRHALLLAAFLTALPLWAAGTVSSEVDLECTLEMGSGLNSGDSVLVELKDAGHGDVYTVTGSPGETVRFKAIKPGIYSLCAWLKAGAPVCRTYDLRLPATILGRVFTRIFRLTSKMKGNQDLLEISRVRLATPPEAKEEMRKSREAYERGKEEEMVQRLLNAIVIYPQYVDAMNNLATYHIAKGDHRTAEAYLKQATSLDPKFYAAWVNLAVCLLSQGKSAESVKAGLKAVKIRPDSAAANSVVGRAYFHLHKYSDAKKYLLKHLSLDPEAQNSSQLLLYQISLSERKYREADQYLNEYFTLHPYAPDVESLRFTQEWIRSKIR